MKKLLVPVIAGLISIAGLAGFISAKNKTATRTEEYAILSVFQEGKRNYISLTVGSQPTQEREFQKEKTEKKYDLAPVVREMESLNQQGFELVNSSTTIVPYAISNDVAGGNPFYTFTFKRKLR
jgi:CO dehydrogenase/acetyl-CoA synthase alpha subunit